MIQNSFFIECQESLILLDQCPHTRVLGVGGDGQEKLLQYRDPMSNPGSEGKDSEKTKKAFLSKKSAPSYVVNIAVETPKDKKRKSEGSKEKGSSTKKKRSSKAGQKEA